MKKNYIYRIAGVDSLGKNWEIRGICNATYQNVFNEANASAFQQLVELSNTGQCEGPYQIWEVEISLQKNSQPL